MSACDNYNIYSSKEDTYLMTLDAAQAWRPSGQTSIVWHKDFLNRVPGSEVKGRGDLALREFWQLFSSSTQSF